MAIAYVGAGTGAEQLVTGTMTVSKTGCTAGNLIMIQTARAGETADGTFGSRVNIEALDGIDLDTDHLRNAGSRQVTVGRVMANGTVSVNIGVGASGEDAVCRLYEFSGASLGTTQATVFEHGAGTFSETGVTTSTTVADAGVTTNGVDRLALQFVCLRTAQNVPNFTGETGGDWTELAEYIGSTMTLQVQSATMASAGTIDGGTAAIASSYWAVIGTAIIPAAVAPTTAGRRMMTLGAG